MEVHVPPGEGAVSGTVSVIFRHIYGRSDVRNTCIRLVCEELAVFPYARYIVEFCVELAFLRHSQVQDRSGG